MANIRETQNSQPIPVDEARQYLDPLKDYMPEGDHPMYAMTRVMIKAEKLSPENVEGRKELMRLLDDNFIHYRGEFRYDLMLGVTEEGQEFLWFELLDNDIAEMVLESDIGVPSTELALSHQFSRGTRTPLRTGYLEINDERIWARDEVGIVRFSTPAFETLLNLYYPKHEIVVRDVDR